MLEKKIKQKLIQIVKEDIGSGDVTTSLIKQKNVLAKITAKESCVLAGVEETVFLFKHFGVKTVYSKRDGSKVKKGQTILKVIGSNKKILSVERVALNFLARLSGVATICASASKIAGNKTKIFLTRKTMPGLNLFDKKACTFGGVFPHRKNLVESILIKENHLKYETIPQILKKAKNKKKKLGLKEIEIEVTNQKEALLAARNSPDVIMLDNFSLKRTLKTIKEIKKINKKVIIELSGCINLKNLKQYVNLGADRVSMGALSRNAKMIDFSLVIK